MSASIYIYGEALEDKSKKIGLGGRKEYQIIRHTDKALIKKCFNYESLKICLIHIRSFELFKDILRILTFKNIISQELSCRV